MKLGTLLLLSGPWAFAACGGNVVIDDGTGGASTADASSSGSTTSSSPSGSSGQGASSGGGSNGTSGTSGTSSSSSGSAGGPTLIIEPTDGMTPIYNLISSATKTLDMTMYELVDTQITSLLTGLVTKGVTVRVILDQNLEMQDNTPAYQALQAGGVQVHWANPTFRATHQKTITVDGATSAIMSLNLASRYYATTRDFAVVTTDAVDIAAIEATFGADFTNTSVTPQTGDDLVWSPTNAQTSLLGLINGATTSLILENEEMSDTTIIAALEAAATRGVDLQIIMTASKSWDPAFNALKGDGAKIVTYDPHASLYIHAKVMVADYGTSAAKVFVGSENFSHASLTDNRELGLITSDAAILSGVNATLTSDFAGGTPY
jgi:cardiolipin synthase A/B